VTKEAVPVRGPESLLDHVLPRFDARQDSRDMGSGTRRCRLLGRQAGHSAGGAGSDAAGAAARRAMPALDAASGIVNVTDDQPATKDVER
jgi:hypothetical protein